MRTMLILIFVYILSSYMQYRWISIAYSKGGVLEYSKPERQDLLFTFLPIANTVVSTIGWVFYPPQKSETHLNNFFNVKK